MALNFKEVDKHTPKDNEVLIRVKMIIPNMRFSSKNCSAFILIESLSDLSCDN